ncbi:hypothetical protein ABKN59_002249 [Abortiporus biennis]
MQAYEAISVPWRDLLMHFILVFDIHGVAETEIEIFLSTTSYKMSPGLDAIQGGSAKLSNTAGVHMRFTPVYAHIHILFHLTFLWKLNINILDPGPLGNLNSAGSSGLFGGNSSCFIDNLDGLVHNQATTFLSLWQR